MLRRGQKGRRTSNRHQSVDVDAENRVDVRKVLLPKGCSGTESEASLWERSERSQSR